MSAPALDIALKPFGYTLEVQINDARLYDYFVLLACFRTSCDNVCRASEYHRYHGG